MIFGPEKITLKFLSWPCIGFGGGRKTGEPAEKKTLVGANPYFF